MNNRLLSCAELVTGRARAVDVGTDHAHLACHLVEQEICAGVTACDINEGPLAVARESVRIHGFEDKITIIRTDGLNGIDGADVSDVIIAGMGGELIAKILDRCVWVKNAEVNLVLQPMSRISLLRRWLYANGFVIKDERTSTDGKFVYTAMRACFSGRKKQLDAFTAYCGKLDFSNTSDRAFLKRQADKLFAAAEGMQKSVRKTREAREIMLTAEKIYNRLSVAGKSE
ncbi:MAG: class I SAM-dependent methyltransferase [Oscillospiraceae bacterium]